MAAKTHNGNLNRSTVPAPAADEGVKSVGKSNGCEATLRKGSLPKSSAVTTVDPNKNKGAGPKSAAIQNSSLRADGKRVQNMIPNTGKRTTTTTAESEPV